MTINENLLKAIELLKQNNIEEPVLKARIILAFILNEPKEYITINSEKQISAKLEEKYNNSLKMLLNDTPLQYITNEREFMGLNFYVNEDVLIPRQDTEILVEQVLKNVGR